MAIVAVIRRCTWAERSPEELKYHDLEWGVPVHDDRLLFEFLVLEGAQAGLSWLTVLRKRPAYRLAFDQFDPERVAAYDNTDLARLMANPNLIRNRLKLRSAITNAQAFLAVQQKYGQFNDYLWDFIHGIPVCNYWLSAAELPTRSDVSDHLSRDLKRRGFSFAGTTICYAYMQAVGMINDHTLNCYRHEECRTIRNRTPSSARLNHSS